MLSRVRRLALAAGLTLGALASIPAGSAGAAEYGVSVCRHADGSVAPTDGWSFAVFDDFAANDTAFNGCSFGGSIDLEFRSSSPHGRFTGAAYTSALISFSALPPSGTSWRQADVWWAYRSDPTGLPGETLSGSIAGVPAATCAWTAVPACSSRGTFSGSPFSAANRSTVPIPAGQSTGLLAVAIGCSRAPSACPAVAEDRYAQLRAWRLRLTIADNSAPAFSAAPALPANAVDGVSVSLSATDGGSGVATAQLIVDGAPAGTPQVIDAANGRCVKASDGTYGHLRPCKPTLAKAPVTVSTAGIPDGTHSIALRIADAAGNTAVTKARTMSVSNSVPLSSIPGDNPLRGKGHVHNGSGSAQSGKLSAGLRRGRSGRLSKTKRVAPGKRMRLAGRLVGADGKPIAGALLSVRSTRPGAAARQFTIRTRASGKYSRSLNWGPSRKLVVRWYPWGDSVQPAAARSVRLLGMAKVTLRVSPARPVNGGALVFTGRVVGAPAGARATVQVRVGRLWRTFLTLQVKRDGRYRGRRTLLLSTGLSYCLRTRVLTQRDFAYSAGSSRTVCRRVR